MKLTFNGRPFNASDFARTLEKEIVGIVEREIPKQVAKKFRNTRTGEVPKITIQKRLRQLSDLDNNTLKVGGSQELVEQIVQKLSNSPKTMGNKTDE